MSSTFAPTVVPGAASPDPGKHVNYVAGMVLGVDDFQQEHANLAGNDARIVRDLIGYGVVAGLRVTIEVDAKKGPRVQVAPGEAVTPSGRILCITPAQCAYLNEWLDANRTAVEAMSSPPPASLPLSVVACYRECPTDSVPIPGEPCRSASELMAPSRIKEAFELQLRLTPPKQLEEEAKRKFVAWARRIPLVDTPGAGVDAFIESLRNAVGFDESPPSSPPESLDDLLFSPPASLEIPSGDASSYFAALLRFWVEELRPRLRSPLPGGECGCSGGSGEIDADADCVLIAELDVPLSVDAPTGHLTVADMPSVAVDDSGRPTLLDVRFLQEWLLAPGGALTVSGRVNADGTVAAATGGLMTTPLDPPDPTLFLLDFPGFDATLEHVVLGQPISAFGDKPSTFEVIPLDDPGLAPSLGSPPGVGVAVRVLNAKSKAVPGGFTVRIEQLGGGS
jgi:hypothetical protein